MKVKSKTIYDLELHESITQETFGKGMPIKWMVTRVPGGWFYQDSNPNRKTVSEFLVPFNDTKKELDQLKKEVNDLKGILNTMIGDMYALSIFSDNRTEFSEELQSCIESWKDDI